MQLRCLCSTVQRCGHLGARVGSCPPKYNIGWAASVFCPPKKISQHISSRPNKQTKRHGPTVLYSNNRKLRSTSTCRIESTHPPVESAHPIKKSFPRYCNSSNYTNLRRTYNLQNTLRLSYDKLTIRLSKILRSTTKLF